MNLGLLVLLCGLGLALVPHASSFDSPLLYPNRRIDCNLNQPGECSMSCCPTQSCQTPPCVTPPPSTPRPPIWPECPTHHTYNSGFCIPPTQRPIHPRCPYHYILINGYCYPRPTPPTVQPPCPPNYTNVGGRCFYQPPIIIEPPKPPTCLPGHTYPGGICSSQPGGTCCQTQPSNCHTTSICLPSRQPICSPCPRAEVYPGMISDHSKAPAWPFVQNVGVQSVGEQAPAWLIGENVGVQGVDVRAAALSDVQRVDINHGVVETLNNDSD